MVVYTLELGSAKWACDRLAEDADFVKKKSSFQVKLIVAFENPHTYIEKPRHPHRVAVWCGFWSRDIIAPFLPRK